MSPSSAPPSTSPSPTPATRRPGETKSIDFGGLGVDWKIDASDTESRFSVVHHPIAPHTLAAPLHYHHNEDEYSYVLRGTLSALLGDDVVTAHPGDWVFKPRNQWHTFWNAGDTPCEIIEVISPAGFENYFRELAESPLDPQSIVQIAERYALDIDENSIPELCERFGLRFGA